MAAPKGNSRARLLDAAEGLFAERGYDTSSIRDIAARSGDTIGTLSYHFKSKDQLLAEVVSRRFDAMAESRREMYRALQTSTGGSLALVDVVRCILLPFLDRAMRGGPEWRNYTALLGRMLHTGNREQFERFMTLSEPTARELINWLRLAAPGAALKDVGYGYQFIIGCMIDACAEVERDRVCRLTDGASRFDDADAVATRLVRFCTAGFAALMAASIDPATVSPPEVRRPTLKSRVAAQARRLTARTRG
jgi:AcrR family transcriptional regulator